MPDLPPPPSAPPGVTERLIQLARLRPRLSAALALGASVVVGACVVLVAARGAPPQPELLLPRATPSSEAAPTELYVHAAGALARPGLYRVEAGSRVANLLDAAGGPTPDADVDRLNLASRLDDGQRVYVPRVGEAAPPDGEAGAADPAAAGEESGPLDLNAATQAQLEELPGVGPSTAKAIIEYRKQNGRFRAVEELLEVRGIGPAKFSEIEPLVKV
ncbi:MAG: helix-hairpin-helix domain-containing protein [Acidimicrobiia bacterium]